MHPATATFASTLYMPRCPGTLSQTRGRYSDSHVLQQDWLKDVQHRSGDSYQHLITGGANRLPPLSNCFFKFVILSRSFLFRISSALIWLYFMVIAAPDIQSKNTPRFLPDTPLRSRARYIAIARTLLFLRPLIFA